MAYRRRHWGPSGQKQCTSCYRMNICGLSFCEFCGSILSLESEDLMSFESPVNAPSALATRNRTQGRESSWLYLVWRRLQSTRVSTAEEEPRRSQAPETQRVWERFWASMSCVGVYALVAGGFSLATGRDFVDGVADLDWVQLTSFVMNSTFERGRAILPLPIRGGGGLDEDEEFWSSRLLTDLEASEVALSSLLHQARHAIAALRSGGTTSTQSHPYQHPPASQKAIEALPEYVVDEENETKEFYSSKEPKEFIETETSHKKHHGQIPEENSMKKEMKGAPNETLPVCSICLDGMGKGSTVKILPCSHRFHSECISNWLSICGLCPLCKASLELA